MSSFVYINEQTNFLSIKFLLNQRFVGAQRVTLKNSNLKDIKGINSIVNALLNLRGVI